MSDASFETESINSKELNFLSNVSIGLTQNSDPADIIESLSESFRQMINLENLNIYIYMMTIHKHFEIMLKVGLSLMKFTIKLIPKNFITL